ncbi:MAG: ribonuclease Z [Bacteroidales bacterium]
MEFSLTTLGTASALPTANRYPSAHVLTVHERLFLIDCGEGAQMQIRKVGIPFTRIDNIFLSHLHGDHLFGIFGFLSTLAMGGRQAPLYIYAPEAFSKVLAFFMEQFGEGIKYEIVHTKVKTKEPLLIYDSKQVEVYAFPLLHRGETYGYLFKEKSPALNVHKHLIEPYNLSLYEIARLKEGIDVKRILDEQSGTTCMLTAQEFTYMPYKPRSFAYCSDTAPFKRLYNWIKGVDLLYHEATYGNELKSLAKTTFHSTTADAALCAKEAEAKKLIISHFSSRYKDTNSLLLEAREVFPNTYLAKEGTKFDIPLQKFK